MFITEVELSTTDRGTLYMRCRGETPVEVLHLYFNKKTQKDISDYLKEAKHA